MVTLPRWPPCPYIVKTLLKSSPEPAGRFNETWYVALGTPAQHSLFKCHYDDLEVTLTYFTALSNFVTEGLLLEKVKKCFFQKLLQPVT